MKKSTSPTNIGHALEISDVVIEFQSGLYPVMVQEPEHLCREVSGIIRAYLEDDEPVTVGKMHLLDVRLGLAGYEYALAPFEVLDSTSASAPYCELLSVRYFPRWCPSGRPPDNDEDDVDLWRNEVRKECEPRGDDLLIINIEIDEPYRGLGLGLAAAYHAIQICGPDLGVVALIPFPTQFSGWQGERFVPPPRE